MNSAHRPCARESEFAAPLRGSRARAEDARARSNLFETRQPPQTRVHSRFMALTRVLACRSQVTEIKVVLKEMMEEEYIDEDDK